MNTKYSTFSSFTDFRNTFRADDSAPKATNNDLVRVWNILSVAGRSGVDVVTMRYEEINISQSSVRTMVSKLNVIFRHLGLLSVGDTCKISQVSDFYCTINFGDVRISQTRWSGLVAKHTGRGQDRADDKHVNGHRENHCGYNYFDEHCLSQGF